MGWVKAKFQSEETRPPLQNSMNKKDTDIETNWERLTAILEGDSIPHDPEVAPRDPIEAKASWDWLAQADLNLSWTVVRAPQAEFLQHFVGDVGEIAIREEQQILRQAHLRVADIDNRGGRRQLWRRHEAIGFPLAGFGFQHVRHSIRK